MDTFCPHFPGVYTMAQLYESYNDVFSLLPVKIYKHDLTGSYLNVPLHWHRSLEITVTLTGCIRFNTGTNNFDFGESDWIFVNSGEPHSCRYINPTDHFSGVSIVISLPFIEKWLGKNLFFYNPENPEVTAQIKAIAAELFSLDDASPDHSLILMSLLFKTLYLVSAHCIRPGEQYHISSDQEMHTAIKFTDYIEKHYQEDVSLDSVAAHFKYSPSYFSRLFKASLGVNFHAYLNFVRVSHAAQQLSSTSVNLTECAFHNGFPNTKSFISTFKKFYGCTPSNFIS